MQTAERIDRPFRPVRSLIAAVAAWWRKRSNGFVDDREESRIARELGIGMGELHELARRGPNAASLLPQRMAALHLDAGSLAQSDRLLLRDLQRVCAMCESKGRCIRDLARDPNDPVWEKYCPNEGTLHALQASKQGGQA